MVCILNSILLVVMTISVITYAVVNIRRIHEKEFEKNIKEILRQIIGEVYTYPENKNKKFDIVLVNGIVETIYNNLLKK